MAPVVSLIVCTRDRATQLQGCLSAIACLKFGHAWELVLVDNGSTDTTADIVREFAAGAAFPVKYVYEGAPGTGHARNAGVLASMGSLLAFTDDDCYVAEDYLERLVAYFADPKLGYLTGRILLHDRTDYPSTINESREPLTFQPFGYIRPGAVKSANMAFRREAMTAIGGFDPLFGAGAVFFGAEDCDVAARASRAGWVGKYTPDVTVSHHHGRKRDAMNQLWRGYDISRGAYHTKLLCEGAVASSLRGWSELLHRARSRPVSVYWELVGALRFLVVAAQQRWSKIPGLNRWTASPVRSSPLR